MVTRASGSAALISASISFAAIAMPYSPSARRRPSRPGRSARAPAQARDGYGSPVGQSQILSAAMCRCRIAGTPGGLGGADQRRRHRAPPAGSGPDPRQTRRHGPGYPRGPVDKPRADAAGHRHLGDRDQQPAIGHVVAGADRAVEDRRAHEIAVARSAARSTGGGAPSSRPAISRSQSDWPSQPCVAPISTRSSQGASARPTALATSSSTPRPPIAGRGQDRAALGLVVEADIAGHDREVERLAGRRHAADGGGELPHDLGLFGVAEIHVVGDRQRPGADRGHVAPGLGHRLRAAHPRGRRGSSAACSRWSGPAPAAESSSLTTAASAAPGRFTVWPPTVLSYWSQIQAREQRSGQAISLQQRRRQPDPVLDPGRVQTVCFGVSIVGRR